MNWNIYQNLARSVFNKHAAKLSRNDKYYNSAEDAESHEQGRVSGVAEHSWLEMSDRRKIEIPANLEKYARNQVCKRMNLQN